MAASRISKGLHPHGSLYQFLLIHLSVPFLEDHAGMKRPSTAFPGSGRAARLPLQCKSPSTAPHPLRGAPRRQTRPPLPSPWQPRSLATRRHSNRRGAPEVRRGRFRPAQRWRRALRSCGGCSGGWRSWNNVSATAAADRKRCRGGAAESGRAPFGAVRRGLGCRCPAGPDSPLPSLCAAAGGGRAGEGAGGAEQYRRQEGEDQNPV